MYKELSDIIYNYVTNEKNVDKDFIYNSVDIIKDKLNVSDYISGITFLPNTDPHLGEYNFVTKNLSINLDYILFRRKTTFQKSIEMIATLFHELDHTSIKKECETGSDEIIHRLYYYTSVSLSEKYKNKTDATYKDILLLLRYLMIYYNNHDLAPFERRAILNSYNNTKKLYLELFKKDLDRKELVNTFLILERNYDKALLSKYKRHLNGLTNAPSYDYCNKLKKILGSLPEEVEVYNSNKIESYNNSALNYSLSDRLLYGLELTNEELKSAKEDVFEKRLSKAFQKNDLTKK